MAALVVVGSGIVGLAAAFHLVRDGHGVTIVDRDPAGDRASFGNAGGIGVTEVIPAAVPGVLRQVPRWLLDPLGPLAVRPGHAWRLAPWGWRFARAGRPAAVERIAAALAALNGRTYDDLVPMLAETGLSAALRRVGALTVYESPAARERDAAAWALKRRHGIEADFIDGEAVRAMEPALGPLAACGVFTPQWSQVTDPRLVWDGLRGWLAGRGVRVIAAEVRSVAGGAVSLADGGRLEADAVVVAAGAWSGRLARTVGDRVSMESERGYNTTIAAPGIVLGREVIFAERSFVAAPLSCGLRIGGAAEFGGLAAAPDYRRSAALVRLARRYLPGLRTDGGRDWAGHRPTTPDSLPVIGRSPRDAGVIYAFGHGHLGLTQAASTGRLVADLVANRPMPIDVSPFGIGRF